MRTNKRRNIRKHRKTIRKKSGGSPLASKGLPLAIKETPLVCSPLVKKSDKVAKDSCITKPVLMRLRNEFNKDHPENPITATRPILVWHEFKMRLSHCADERCFLNEIDEPSEKQKLLHTLFAPEHPPEWLQNKNEWLSNHDIDKVMKQYEERYKNFKYLGTSAIDYDFKYSDGHCVEDQLCKFFLKDLMAKGKTRFASVFNLDEHKERGSHWVSIFIDVKHKSIVFFDSAKGGIPEEIERFVETVKAQGLEQDKPIKFKFLTNKSDHQQGDTECGVYSIHFIIEMLESFKSVKRFLYGNITDKEMENLRPKLFNKPA
jgi:hypothetical protein